MWIKVVLAACVVCFGRIKTQKIGHALNINILTPTIAHTHPLKHHKSQNYSSVA